MKYVKFAGLLKEIREQYNPNFNLHEFLKTKLNIDDKKAELMYNRINDLFDFETDFLLKKEKPVENNIDTKDKNEGKFNIYSLDSISGKEFEDFLKWLFGELGYHVELTQVTADSGVDLVLIKDKIKTAVQAKRYNRNTKISNAVVLKTQGGMGVYKCHKSMIVTTSFFTRQAISDAKALDLELWDRDYLSSVIDKINNHADQVSHKVEFPSYESSLYRSLINLEKMDIFSLKNKNNGKYDIYRHGIRYPILSFRSNANQVNHLSFRIKKNEPIPEYGPSSWALITSDRGSIYGPGSSSAYSQIVQYLSEFI